MNWEVEINSVLSTAKIAGFDEYSHSNISIDIWGDENEEHIQKDLPQNAGAVYIFKYQDEYLKVGKVSSFTSNPRYKYQHYQPSSNGSTLARSLLNSDEFKIDSKALKTWIKENTTRINIIIPHLENDFERTKKFIHFVEAYFILKCNPKFENSRV